MVVIDELFIRVRGQVFTEIQYCPAQLMKPGSMSGELIERGPDGE